MKTKPSKKDIKKDDMSGGQDSSLQMSEETEKKRESVIEASAKATKGGEDTENKKDSNAPFDIKEENSADNDEKAPEPKKLDKSEDLCKKCGGAHSLEKCSMGKSMNQMKELEKGLKEKAVAAVTGAAMLAGGAAAGVTGAKTLATTAKIKQSANMQANGPKAPKAQGVKMLKAELKPGMSMNDLRKAEMNLEVANEEVQALAKSVRTALDNVRSKLQKKEEPKPQAPKKEESKGCPHCGQTMSKKPGHGHDEECKLYRPMKK